ncbi:MAG: hypothetical protein HEQ35_29675 [Gloeotrichia echinulata IR180]
MATKGGRRKTTWNSGSQWKSGATKTIRIPIALSTEIMEYARRLDEGVAVPENNKISILNAIDDYINWRQQNYRSTPSAKEPNLASRTWDELRKFKAFIEENTVRI